VLLTWTTTPSTRPVEDVTVMATSKAEAESADRTNPFIRPVHWINQLTLGCHLSCRSAAPEKNGMNTV
jgi:hypothetical protein